MSGSTTRPAECPTLTASTRRPLVVPACVLLALVAGAPHARAQEEIQGLRRTLVSFSLPEPSPFLPSNGIVAGPVAPSAQWLDAPAFTVPPLAPPLRVPLAVPSPPTVAPAPRVALHALEASFAALQVLDAVSTLKAIDRGHTEQNPLMRGLVDRPAAFLAVKAGATVTTLWLVRRVARQNRLAALLTMAAIDSGYAVLVSRNLQVLRR